MKGKLDPTRSVRFTRLVSTGNAKRIYAVLSFVLWACFPALGQCLSSKIDTLGEYDRVKIGSKYLSLAVQHNQKLPPVKVAFKVDDVSVKTVWDVTMGPPHSFDQFDFSFYAYSDVDTNAFTYKMLTIEGKKKVIFRLTQWRCNGTGCAFVPLCIADYPLRGPITIVDVLDYYDAMTLNLCNVKLIKKKTGTLLRFSNGQEVSL